MAFPDIPNIEQNPLTPALQAFILEKTLAWFADRDPKQAQYQLSQVLAVFRDGFVLPFAGLVEPVDAMAPKPLGKSYSLPVDVGTIVYANQLGLIATQTAGNVPAASIWYPQGTQHICTGG